jgi:pimeloyl-ACP methyl ester carboxylesterase
MNRVIGAGAGLLAIVLALLFVITWAGDQRATPRDPLASSKVIPDPESKLPPEPELARFYEQDVAWEKCRDDLACTTVEVPLDYSRPGGQTIEIAVLKVPAREKARGSLLVNPGGPGASGMDYAAYEGQVFTRPILAAYDIIGFDPRGTGESSPVDCLSDAELSDFVSADPVPNDAVEGRELRREMVSFAQSCRALSGQVAEHVTTVEAAKDMDIIRAVLGESKLDYLGASYGTKLGATYAELFPKRVGRMVLDGALDSALSNKELVLGQAAGFEGQLRAYVANCLEVSAGECFLGSDVDEGVATIQNLLAQIDREPLPADGDRELTSGDAFYGLVTPLYSSDSWLALSTALKQALAGDGSTLLTFADLYSSRNTDDSFSDNTVEANYLINCTDSSEALTPRQVPGVLAEFTDVSPTFGPALAWSLVACGGFPTSRPEPEIDAGGADPIVVIGTTGDPATPYEWAVSLAGQLESGVLITREGDGHTGYNMGNSCVDELVEEYLVAGVVPEDGVRC